MTQDIRKIIRNRYKLMNVLLIKINNINLQIEIILNKIYFK